MEKITGKLERVYTNEKPPIKVIEMNGLRISDYDGSIVGDAKEGDVVDVEYITKEGKEPGKVFNNLRKLEVFEDPNKNVIEVKTFDLQDECQAYAEIYHKLVSLDIPRELANTSASTIYIQRSKKL